MVRHKKAISCLVDLRVVSLPARPARNCVGPSPHSRDNAVATELYSSVRLSSFHLVRSGKSSKRSKSAALLRSPSDSWSDTPAISVVKAIYTEYSITMDEMSLQHSHSTYHQGDGGKTAEPSFPNRYSHPSRLDEHHVGQEEQVSCPNTPSMTRGSSRSTSSSVVPCDVYENASTHCVCQNHGEGEAGEAIRFFPTDAWSVQLFHFESLEQTQKP